MTQEQMKYKMESLMIDYAVSRQISKRLEQANLNAFKDELRQYEEIRQEAIHDAINRLESSLNLVKDAE